MSDELLIAVLAAGASRRLGQPKQLVPFDGEPLLRRVCRVAIDARIGPVAVVLGCRREEIKPVVSDLPVTILTNNDWAEGMASSVRVATIMASKLKCSGVLLLQCDQYAIASADLVRLRDAWRAQPILPCLSRDGDYLGPPAILPASMFDALLTLTGDTGPRAILRDRKVNETIILGASRDIDEPSDLNCLKRSAGAREKRFESFPSKA